MRWTHLLLIAAFVTCATGVFYGSYSYFKGQELERAAARLTLYRSTAENELRHFAHLPFLLSLDPVVQSTLTGGDPQVLNVRLARFAQSAGLDAIYLMDRTGDTIAASNAQRPSSFVGQNYGFRPYFQDAMNGELGEFYGIGATTGIPGYFYAMPVGIGVDGPAGVIAIKVDLSALQDSWQASGERIILSNASGIVLLASDPEWRYRTLETLSDQQRDQIASVRQFGQEPLEPLPWTRDRINQTADIDGQKLLYLATTDLPNSWELHFFLPDDEAVTRAALSTGVMVLMAVLTIIALQIRRGRMMGEALRKSEDEEVLLRRANERLAIEIDERRSAEQALKKTQADLERAGRLAALGQLASSVTHELGQPIAAMRNQIVASEMTSGPSVLGEKMQGLVARMENITKQLKFFSRKGRDQFEAVDIDKVLADALELLVPSIARTGASVDVQNLATPVFVHANRLRLEQVITNIVRNALDAVDGGDVRQITIATHTDKGRLYLDVTDTGHGLGEYTLDDLREPFKTTRESGQGMGLGLTISAGIVSDHGGTITAWDNPTGGATFRIDLPCAPEDATT